jgi:hypothetical protein
MCPEAGFNAYSKMPNNKPSTFLGLIAEIGRMLMGVYSHLYWLEHAVLCSLTRRRIEDPQMEVLLPNQALDQVM